MKIILILIIVMMKFILKRLIIMEEMDFNVRGVIIKEYFIEEILIKLMKILMIIINIIIVVSAQDVNIVIYKIN